jgi:hypothetical protein
VVADALKRPVPQVLEHSGTDGNKDMQHLRLESGRQERPA